MELNTSSIQLHPSPRTSDVLPILRSRRLPLPETATSPSPRGHGCNEARDVFFPAPSIPTVFNLTGTSPSGLLPRILPVMVQRAGPAQRAPSLPQRGAGGRAGQAGSYLHGLGRQACVALNERRGLGGAYPGVWHTECSVRGSHLLAVQAKPVPSRRHLLPPAASGAFSGLRSLLFQLPFP